jgi:hypothetical protein
MVLWCYGVMALWRYGVFRPNDLTT